MTIDNLLKKISVPETLAKIYFKSFRKQNYQYLAVPLLLIYMTLIIVY